MFNLIIVSVVFLNWDLDSFFHIVHIAVEMWDVLNVSDGLWDVKRLLFIYDLLYLFHFCGGVPDWWMELRNVSRD